MKKKLLFTATAVVMLLIAVRTVCAISFTYGDLSYTISDEEVSIIDCSTSATSVTIPSTIDGYPVTSIGNRAFLDCTSLTSITIPDSVTSIGSGTFGDCSSLTSIKIPESVTSIGQSAFSKCTRLTSITIPDSVTSIGQSAFYKCTSLTSITIPDSVTRIDEGAFARCPSLTSITIPDRVTSICDYTFLECTSLTSITIPDSVTSIGYRAFDETAYYNDSTNWTNNVLYIGNHLIVANTTISGSYTIKSGTKCIGSYAFRDCTSLTSITIPDSVTSIGAYAFQGCKDLTIYGRSGSYAATYANENNIPFIVLYYSIIYDANGGENAPEAQTKTRGVDLTLSDTIPTKTGYKFSHWTTAIKAQESLSVTGIESAHGYANNANQTWTISHSSAKSITLTFDSKTAFEDECDFLYIYDCNGNQVGKYTGTTLAGKTLTIVGDSVKLKLTSDFSTVKWGFRVTSATAENDAKTYESGASYTSDKDAVLYAVWESVCSTTTTATKYPAYTLCTVSLSDIPNGNTLIVAAYKDGILAYCEPRTVTQDSETFEIIANVDTVKVFVFEKIDTLKPLTKCETIEL